MGAKITLENERVSGGEAAADIRVEAAKLHGTSFGAEIMPRLIDEIQMCIRDRSGSAERALLREAGMDDRIRMICPSLEGK